MTILEIQRALKQRGYSPGPLDGIWGRQSIAAVKELQGAFKLDVTGVIDPDTVSAINIAPLAGSHIREKAILLRDYTPPVWFLEMQRRKGLHEGRDRSRLMAWLKSDGATLGDPAKLPWCGDGVQTAIALTLPEEPLPANPYLARSWLRFGVPMTEPAVGQVLVFWRGSRTGTSGHVCFYAGERADGAIRVLGCNQSNAITEAWLDRERLLGRRWPSTVPLPRAGRKLLASNGEALSVNEA